MMSTGRGSLWPPDAQAWQTAAGRLHWAVGWKVHFEARQTQYAGCGALQQSKPGVSPEIVGLTLGACGTAWGPPCNMNPSQCCALRSCGVLVLCRLVPEGEPFQLRHWRLRQARQHLPTLQLQRLVSASAGSGQFLKHVLATKDRHASLLNQGAWPLHSNCASGRRPCIQGNVVGISPAKAKALCCKGSSNSGCCGYLHWCCPNPMSQPYC